MFVYPLLSLLENRKTKQEIKQLNKMANVMKRQFLYEIQMANNHIE